MLADKSQNYVLSNHLLFPSDKLRVSPHMSRNSSGISGSYSTRLQVDFTAIADVQHARAEMTHNRL